MSDKDNWIPMPRFLLRKDAIKRLLKTQSLHNKKILEIGFGSGEMLNWFAQQGAVVHGLDFSEQAHRLATHRLTQIGSIDSITLFSKFSDLQTGSYDFVFAFEVLEHIEDDQGAIEDWLKLLKNNGFMALSVPAHMSKWCKNDEWAGHIKRYEKTEFKTLFDHTDVSLVRVWNYGFPVILLLDKLLEKNHKGLQPSNQSDIEKTKKSGVDRPNKKLYRWLSNDWVLLPAYWLQRLFFNTDLGSGYLVHVEKKTK